jgi:hypothetical protein
MTSQSNAEQEEPTTGLTTTDSEFDVEEFAHSDVDEGMQGTENTLFSGLLCPDWIRLQLLGRVKRIGLN